MAHEISWDERDGADSSRTSRLGRVEAASGQLSVQEVSRFDMEAPAAGDEGRSVPVVLVVDDEPRVAEAVRLTLQDEGFRVLTANDGKRALELAARERPDIAVIDIIMPGLDGHAVMSALREDASIPVIFLTARTAVKERREGLDLGADDYVVKPFHADELAARVRAVLRRGARGAATNALQLGELQIDFDRRLLTRNGQPIQLSRIEWLLLQYLARNLGKVVLHTDLLRYVWGAAYAEDVQILRVCISRLRAKLGSGSGRRGLIRTYVGVGYALEPNTDAGAQTRRRRGRARAASADESGNRPRGRRSSTR